MWNSSSDKPHSEDLAANLEVWIFAPEASESESPVKYEICSLGVAPCLKHQLRGHGICSGLVHCCTLQTPRTMTRLQEPVNSCWTNQCLWMSLGELLGFSSSWKKYRIVVRTVGLYHVNLLKATLINVKLFEHRFSVNGSLPAVLTESYQIFKFPQLWLSW